MIAKSRVLAARTSVLLPRISGAEMRLTEPATPWLRIWAVAATLLRTRAPPELITSVVTALPVPPKLIVPVVTVPDAPTSRARLPVRPTPSSVVSVKPFGNATFGFQLAEFAHDWVPPPRTFQVKTVAAAGREATRATQASVAIAVVVLRVSIGPFPWVKTRLESGITADGIRAETLRQWPRSPWTPKCDESGMGRDETGLVACGCAPAMLRNKKAPHTPRRMGAWTGRCE